MTGTHNTVKELVHHPAIKMRAGKAIPLMKIDVIECDPSNQTRPAIILIFGMIFGAAVGIVVGLLVFDNPAFIGIGAGCGTSIGLVMARLGS